jgi:hypothetical protein
VVRVPRKILAEIKDKVRQMSQAGPRMVMCECERCAYGCVKQARGRCGVGRTGRREGADVKGLAALLSAVLHWDSSSAAQRQWARPTDVPPSLQRPFLKRVLPGRLSRETAATHFMHRPLHARQLSLWQVQQHLVVEFPISSPLPNIGCPRPVQKLDSVIPNAAYASLHQPRQRPTYMSPHGAGLFPFLTQTPTCSLQ